VGTGIVVVTVGVVVVELVLSGTVVVDIGVVVEVVVSGGTVVLDPITVVVVVDVGQSGHSSSKRIESPRLAGG
jgi:hypothetical protein